MGFTTFGETWLCSAITDTESSLPPSTLLNFKEKKPHIRIRSSLTAASNLIANRYFSLRCFTVSFPFLLSISRYTIQLTHGQFTWTIKRRYKHISALHQHLRVYRASLHIPFPTRSHRERRASFRDSFANRGETDNTGKRRKLFIYTSYCTSAFRAAPRLLASCALFSFGVFFSSFICLNAYVMMILLHCNRNDSQFQVLNGILTLQTQREKRHSYDGTLCVH